MNKNKICITFRLDEDLHSKIVYIAQEETRSLNSQIEFAVKQYIKAFEDMNGVIVLPKKQ